MPLVLKASAEEVYVPPVRVTVPVGVAEEPVTVTVTESELVVAIDVALGVTATVAVVVFAVLQYVMRLVASTLPRPVARS